MTDEPSWFRDDLEPDVDDAERVALWHVADVLIASRPFPRAAFRGALSQRLAAQAGGGSLLERPRALWARVGVLALSGTALLALVAIGTAGSGPFAG